MKAYVCANLRGSKLALLFATIFIVAIVSVVGFCFTNANADNSAESSNAAEINIPVKNLAFAPTGEKIFYGETPWNEWSAPAPVPSEKSIDSYEFRITDPDYQWIDVRGDSEILLSNDLLILMLATKNNDVYLYKTWTFSFNGPRAWYIVENDKLIEVTQIIKLDSTKSYSIFYGKPDAFNVKSETSDVDNIFGEYSTFYGETKQI